MNEMIEAICEDFKDSIDSFLKEYKRVKSDIHKIKIKLDMYKEEDILD